MYSAIARVSSVVALRLAHEAGNDFAVPQHVVGDEQAARPEQIDEPIEQRHVQLLVAVLKDQIERPGDLGEQPLGVADHDVDAIGQPGALEIRRARSRARSGSISIVISMPSGGSAPASQMPE